MFATLRHQWATLRRARPGKRFQRRYEAHKKERASPLWRPVYLLLGTTIFVAGLAMLPAPGPGFLILFLGAGMLAEESLWVAKAMDALEVKTRAVATPTLRAWKRASAAVKAGVVAAGAAVAAGAGFAAYLIVTG